MEAFETGDPLMAARILFFPDLTVDQLRILHDAAMLVADRSREEVVNELGIDLETISSIKPDRENRTSVSSLHEIIANSEVINDRTILYTALYLKKIGNEFSPKQIDEIVAEAHSATTINAEAEFG